MEVNVSQQLKSPIGTVREYDVNEIADILGIGVSTLIEGKLKFTRTHRGILVQGNLTGKVPLECSRCLKLFKHPLNIKIEEEFFPVLDVNTGTPVEIPDEPGAFTIDAHHVLDLTESIRQNALLAVPMQPLCRQDCKGLCVKCGRDLNQGQCNCERETIDPRWSKLAGLAAAAKKKNKQKKETKQNGTPT